MDGRLLARIGTALFAGLAVALVLAHLLGEPQRRAEPRTAVWIPDSDPLPAQLRRCSQMGEPALSSPDCRAAWAEKRRRFFGADFPDAYSAIAGDPTFLPPAHPAPRHSGEN